MNKFTIYFEGIQIVLKDKFYMLSFLLLSLFLLWFFIYIPVRNIPGNDFRFQLSLFKPLDYLLLTTLSLLTSLSITMNVYSFRHQPTTSTGVTAISQVGIGSMSGIIASIFGTVSCSTCVVSLFGFLGIGTVFFLLEYKNYIVLASTLLVLFSLYFTSKKVLQVCKECNNLHRKINKDF